MVVLFYKEPFVFIWLPFKKCWLKAKTFTLMKRLVRLECNKLRQVLGKYDGWQNKTVITPYS